MVSRKRTRSEVDTAPEQPPEEPGLLQKLRNCWEFASLMQYIAIFGKVMKIDEDFGIEVRSANPTPPVFFYVWARSINANNLLRYSAYRIWKLSA